MMTKKFTVFVLDDDKMFCDLLCALSKLPIFTSKSFGYDVIFTIHSDMQKIDDAIRYIKTEKPDLILLDYMLGPLVDSCFKSLDLLKKIVPCSSDIRLMTGLHPKDARLIPIKEILADTHLKILLKPIDIGVLVDTIREGIRRKEHV